MVGAAFSQSRLTGQLVSFDGFSDYAAGVQLESGASGSPGTGLNGGAAWGSAYKVNVSIKQLVRIEDRTSTPIRYEAGDVLIEGGDRALRFYDNANGTFAGRRRRGPRFSAAAGESLWFSLLFRTASASPLQDQDFFQIGFDDNLSALAGNPRVSIGANTISSSFPADLRFFARSTTNIASSAFDETVPIEAATTYLLVGHIQPNSGQYDLVRLFINPTSTRSPGIPAASVSQPSGLASLSHLFIRSVGLDAGDAFVVDEIHIGRSYGSVVRSLAGALRIDPASGPPVLRWPASLGDFILEGSPDMKPDSWTVIPGPFLQNGIDHENPVPQGPGEDRRFFRLRRF